MYRQTFLTAALLIGSVPSLDDKALAQIGQPPVTPGKLVLVAPLTHSDWMLKPGVVWGEEGVRHMLDACKACGWVKIYWLVFDGGRSCYKSELLSTMGRWDADSFWTPESDADTALMQRFTPGMSPEKRAELLKKFDALDYAPFDTLAAAVRYGHEIGLEIHAWLSINEDDHGWGLQSEFSKKHTEFRWRQRDGRAYHSQLSFAFPEVRQYKLAPLKELLAYDIDDFFFDWIRTGDVRDNPQTDAEGVAGYGYEEPLVEHFKKEFGDDPAEISNGDERWVRMRAEPQTKFMRAAHKLIRSHPRRPAISALVGHPWHYRGEQNKIDGNLRGLLLDLATWGRDGLVDAVVARGTTGTGATPNSHGRGCERKLRAKWTCGLSRGCPRRSRKPINPSQSRRN